MSKEKKRVNPLPIIAAVVIVAAAVATQIPKWTEEKEPSPSELQLSESAPLTDDGSIIIKTGEIGTQASYFDYDANGTTVQVFALKASDDTIRLALNTCQVCNGSPYAYFEQDGDQFICQNCKNRFASTEIGIVKGGCRPVPITDDIYTVQDDTIIIPASFLEENATLFQNWKNF